MKTYTTTAKVINIQDAKREAMAARYKEIKEAQAALAKEEKEVKAYLMGFVPDNTTATIGALTIVHKVSTSRGLDTATLKKELPELWDEYGKDSERHTIEIL